MLFQLFSAATILIDLLATVCDGLYHADHIRQVPSSLRDHVTIVAESGETRISLHGVFNAYFAAANKDNASTVAIFTLQYAGNNFQNCITEDNDLQFTIVHKQCWAEFRIQETVTVVHFGDTIKDIVLQRMASTVVPQIKLFKNGTFSFGTLPDGPIHHRDNWCSIDAAANNEGAVALKIVAPRKCGAYLRVDPITKLLFENDDRSGQYTGEIFRQPPDYPQNKPLELPYTLKVRRPPQYGDCFWTKGRIRSTDKKFSLFFLVGGNGRYSDDHKLADTVLVEVRIWFEDNRISISSLRNFGESWRKAIYVVNPSNERFDFRVCFGYDKFHVYVNGTTKVDLPYASTGVPISKLDYVHMEGDAAVERFRFTGGIFTKPYRALFNEAAMAIGQTLHIGVEYGPKFEIQFFDHKGNIPFYLHFDYGFWSPKVVMNSYIDGAWGDEAPVDGYYPFYESGTAYLTIKLAYDKFTLTVAGGKNDDYDTYHEYEMSHRVSALTNPPVSVLVSDAQITVLELQAATWDVAENALSGAVNASALQTR